MANGIGIITEQNDLGLGFDPLSSKDQEAYQKNNQTIKTNYDSDERNDKEPKNK